MQRSDVMAKKTKISLPAGLSPADLVDSDELRRVSRLYACGQAAVAEGSFGANVDFGDGGMNIGVEGNFGGGGWGGGEAGIMAGDGGCTGGGEEQAEAPPADDHDCCDCNDDDEAVAESDPEPSDLVETTPEEMDQGE